MDIAAAGNEMHEPDETPETETIVEGPLVGYIAVLAALLFLLLA